MFRRATILKREHSQGVDGLFGRRKERRTNQVTHPVFNSQTSRAQEEWHAIDEGDWELIESLDAERRCRRESYDPEGESFSDPAAGEIKDERVPESADVISPALSAGLASSAQPEVSTSPDAEPIKGSSLAPANRSQGTQADLDAPVERRQDHPAYGIASIDELLNLDEVDAGPEDQAQRQFEQSMVLATDIELEIEIEIEVEHGGNEDQLDDDEGLYAFHQDDDLESAWEDFAFDANDYDDAPSRGELRPIATAGSLTRRQRARQQALEVGIEVGWDEEGIAVLTEVFDRHGWSQSKIAIRRELQAGMTPDDLAMAMEVRSFWAAHPEFSMDLGWFGGRDWGESARAIYRRLSWPMALALVRLHDGHADIDYLEHMLCELFDDWYSSRVLRRRCSSFNRYLFRRLGMGGQPLAEWPDWTFTPDPSLGLEFDEDHTAGVSSPCYQALSGLGLIPRPSPVAAGRRTLSPRPVVAKAASSTTQNADRGPERPAAGKNLAPNRSGVGFDSNRIRSYSTQTPARVCGVEARDATSLLGSSASTRTAPVDPQRMLWNIAKASLA
jgi:hypothetical protein